MTAVLLPTAMIHRTPVPGPSHETQTADPEPSDNDTPQQNAPADCLPLFGADDPLAVDVQCHNTPSPSHQPLPALIGGTAEDAESSQGPSAMGRTPASVTTILEMQFQEFHLQFSQLASCMGLPVVQLVACFSKPFARMNTGNKWNDYQHYHITHRAQELRRLGEDDVITATPSKSSV